MKLEPYSAGGFELPTISMSGAVAPGGTLGREPSEPVPSSGVTIAPKGGVAREASEAEIAQPSSQRSSLSAFGQSALEQFANSVMAIPSAVGDAFTVNPFADAVKLFKGEVPDPVIGNIPRISMSDFRSPESQAARTALDAEFPIATTLGAVTGDVATLLTGRAATGRLGAANKPIGVSAGGLEGALKTGLEKIKRGAGKAAEVGIEGAALATLNEGDPLKAAAMAGGAQAFGSLALTVGGFPFKSGTHLALSAAGLMAVIQTFKALTPGGRDRVLDSAETAFEKIGIGGLIGGMAGLFGAGRLAGSNITTSLPKLGEAIADTINVGLRGPAISVWKNMSKATEEEVNRAEQTLSAIIISPEQFDAPERRELQKEIDTGGAGLFSR